MKELENKKENRTELSVKKRQQVEREYIGQIIPHKGHTVFEINVETEEIEKAQYIHTTYVFNQENKTNEILVREGFAYVSALNAKNALKKYRRGENGSKKVYHDVLKLTKI